MKILSQRKVVTAHGSTPEEFDRDFNNKTGELSQRGIEYDIEMNTNAGFIAHIFYVETVKVAETVRDEFSLKGITHFCYECPYFEPSADRRHKWVRCRYAEPYTSADSECCETFYRRLMNGEIEIKEAIF